MYQPTVNAVVVTYNRRKLLEDCVAAISSQTYPISKTYIVNNKSTDGTKEYLETLDKERFSIFNAEQNLGGAWGFEQGVRLNEQDGGYDLLLLIDDDAILDKDCILNIVQEAERHCDVEAFSTTVIEHGEINIGHRKLISSGFKARFAPVPAEEYEKESFCLDLASFCGLVVRRSIIKKIGLPRGDFFIWYDDTEYSLRIRRHSAIINSNRALLYHRTKAPVQDAGTSAWKMFYGERNFTVVRKEYFPAIGNLLVIGRKIATALKLTLTGKRAGKYRLGPLLLNAYWDGITGKLGKNNKYLP